MTPAARDAAARVAPASVAPARVAPAWWIAAAAGLAAVLLVTGLAGLLRDRAEGVLRDERDVDGIPVTVLRPEGGAPAPGLVVAHGFAGSAVLMDGLATAWARAGFAVAVLDFAGHGRNPAPLPQDRGALAAQVDTVAGWLGDQPFASPAPLQLVGHSMGAGAVVAAAVADPRYASTVALSLPSAEDIPAGRPGVPANLLLLWGAAEQPRFAEAALRGLRAGYPDGEPGTVYGDPAEGTARQAREVPGAEHLSILWRSDTAQWTYDWLSAPAGLPPTEVRLAPRMLGAGLVALGTVLALVPLSALVLGNARPSLPRPTSAARSLLIMVAAGTAASLLAAAAAPLADALPLAVGGHLLLWFTAGALVLLLGARACGARLQPPTPRTLGAAIALAGFISLLLTASGRMSWAPVALVGPRVWLFVLFAAALLAWFLGDEALVAREARSRRALLLLASRLFVVGFLLGGVFLLGAPSFLLLLLPLMVPLLALLAVAAWTVGARTSVALVPAAVQAVPLALLVATTFPLLAD